MNLTIDRRATLTLALFGFLAAMAPGCSGDDPDDLDATGGHHSASGGAGVAGGATGSGGLGGGGASTPGGTGGSSAGSTSGAGGGPTGGASGGGGVLGTGGFATTGGASSSGGAQASGGASSSGGTPSSGGASSGGAGGATSGPGVVGKNGALRVSRNRIVNAAGQAVQLRGMSLFWSQWSGYHVPGTVDQLVDDWQSTIVRAPLGVEETGGYLQNAAANEAKVVAIADRAVQRGVYVIIDWHDHHAESHQSAAVDFFTRMGRKYGSSPAVIFEIYNEPLQIPWQTVKSYAESVIGAIRGTGARNLIIVGTPTWSQDVDVASKSPITTDTNVAYTLHFYAATHKQFIRDKAKAALDAGLPIFVTEWGACEASGNGALDQNETRTWLDFLSQNQVSWANWSLNNKAESCSALTPSTGTTGPWAGSALTASGALVKPLIR